MKAISIVRQRGQLTIPDQIRKMADWISPMSAISISLVTPDEIVIRPHNQYIDKNKVWENIKKARSIQAKNSISALESIEKDRSSH